MTFEERLGQTLWIWYSLCVGAATKSGPKGLRRMSLTDIYRADAATLRRVGGFPEKMASRLADKDIDRAQEISDWCTDRQIRVIGLTDSAYPASLAEIENPPCVLYIRGKLPEFGEKPAFAVVGSRKRSDYGGHTAQTIAYELARQGFAVISGLARGIDTEAHKGAVKAGGYTVAVLGNGFDRCYPPENESMLEYIASAGTVISEYPPFSEITPSNFPVRNRIISALSSAVIVVEARQGSGALITAELARKQGRSVYSVPGLANSPWSKGSNELIRNGAKLISGARDVLEDFGFEPLCAPVSQAPSPFAEEDPPASLGEGEGPEARILRALKQGPKTTDELARLLQQDAGTLMGTLTLMEMKEDIRQTAGGLFRLV